MSGGYSSPTGDGIAVIIADLAEIRDRLAVLEIPTGTSMNSLVEQVQQAITEIGTTVNAWLLANAYTKTQIDSLIASPGAIAPTAVTASGAITGASVTSSGNVSAAGKVRGGNIYGNILSVDYRTVSVTGVDGSLGHVPSSRRFKRDIVPVSIDPLMIAALQLVNYRYVAAVEQLGDDAALEWGLIAEEVDALGLTWLVDYDEEGKPFAVKYERLALAFIPYLQSMEERVSALESYGAQ